MDLRSRMRSRSLLPLVLLGIVSASTMARAQNDPAQQTDPQSAQKLPQQQKVKNALAPQKMEKNQEHPVKPAFTSTPQNQSPEEYDQSQQPDITLTRPAATQAPVAQPRVVAPALTLSPIPAKKAEETQTASPTPPPPPPPITPAVPHSDYSNLGNWLCLPDRQDACVADLTTSIISANGKIAREGWFNDPHAPVDCFYVYPTVSTQNSDNSDLTQTPEEKAIVRNQFARFTTICRPFVPMYRQFTLKSFEKLLNGQSIDAAVGMAYQDVADAWHYYLDHDNQGRGVILIGDSQGAILLERLIQNEIDGKPVQARIISAALIGTNIQVAKQSDHGGTFARMHICTSDKQTGCIITYSSFPANTPPRAGNPLSAPDANGTITACTNPAALAGGSGNLHAYLVANPAQSKSKAAAEHWLKSRQPITTPFVSLPGMLKSECMSDSIGTYLAVSIIPDANETRTGEIGGMMTINGHTLADWGYHSINLNLAQGNLYYLFRQQALNWRMANQK